MVWVASREAWSASSSVTDEESEYGPVASSLCTDATVEGALGPRRPVEKTTHLLRHGERSSGHPVSMMVSVPLTQTGSCVPARNSDLSVGIAAHCDATQERSRRLLDVDCGKAILRVVTGTGWYSCVGAPGSLVGRSCCISIGRHYDRRRRSSHRYECWVSSGAICQRGRTGGVTLPGPQHRRPRRAVLAPSRARAIVVPRQEQGERSFTQSAPWTCPHCRQSAPPGIHE